MSIVNLRVLEGIERGRVYQNLSTPVKIGREEDNDIQLNDDRVSRYHSKIQESEGHIILTDLQSTNGTRVNGFPVSVRVLQLGDHIWIGRCLLQFEPQLENLADTDTIEESGSAEDVDRTINHDYSQAPGVAPSGFDGGHDLFPQGAPELPQGLTGHQLAMLSDILAFSHHQLVQVANMAIETEVKIPNHEKPINGMLIPYDFWQRQLNLQMVLAEYLRSISEPAE